MSSAPHKPRITQVFRNNSTPANHSKVAADSEYRPFPSRRSRTPSDTRRFDTSLENEYRRQYSCPTGDLFKPQNADAKDKVAAYVLQPDGTMAAVRWDDKSALEYNRPVLSALKQEQQAQLYGETTGRIQNTNNANVTLHPEMLNWLASDEDTFSSNSSSSKVSGKLCSPNRYQQPQTYHRGYSTSSAGTLSPPIGQSGSNDNSQYSVHMKNPQTAAQGQGHAKRNNLKIISSSAPSGQLPNYDSHSTTSAPKQQQLSPPVQESTNIRRTTSSDQVQESYWSPQESPTRQQHKSYTVAESTHTSLQQRQLSIERAPRLQPRPFAGSNVSSAAETSVWDYFKGYDRCATSDF